MNIRKITKDIYYVGVNDRTTTKFEAMWPLPYGVSYNSYIVAGDEKVALIDTVSIDEVREYFRNLDEIAGDRPIDYLVINHMEPDHSGSIPEVVRRYPHIKIVGNAKTIEMIKGFYHIDDMSRYITVKDGEELSLGQYTLRFYLTPMVHWPETMMTYVEQKSVLFSGDAFGTFGALNGGVTDEEIMPEVHLSEMYRYYSNIVGKYGKFVERALAKLESLELKYICPTHGPVWHERIAEVVKITSQLATYESEPGVVIVYGSMYGNTAEVAEMIAREIAALGVKRIMIHNVSHTDMSYIINDAFRYGTLIVGTATYSMRVFPPIEDFLNAMETREIKNKIFATFSSFTWAPNAAAQRLSDFSEKMNLPTVATVAIKQSSNEETRQEAKRLAAAVVEAMKAKTPSPCI